MHSSSILTDLGLRSPVTGTSMRGPVIVIVKVFWCDSETVGRKIIRAEEAWRKQKEKIKHL